MLVGRHLSYPGWAAEYIWLYGMLESGDYTFPHKVAQMVPRRQPQRLGS